MKSYKLNRVICLALATVFCLGAIASPAKVSVSAKSEYNEPTVRVGMYVYTPLLDTKRFSSKNVSENGFDIGYSTGDSFHTLCSVSNKSVVLLPQVNASLNGDRCTPDENGAIGAYSAVMGSYHDAASAFSAAKSSGGFVAFVKGGYEVRKFASNSASQAKKASGGREVASPVSGGLTVLDGESGKILFTFEDSSRTLALRAKNGGSVTIPMKHRSGSENHYNYRGFFEYSVSGSQLYMVNVLGLEEYTRCVMANEIGTNFSVETRKAFAVLARTVPLNSKHGKLGFDVCSNSACCQVYHGIYRMSDENNAIVDSTRGLVCTYNGAPIAVLYHNSNGGASCSSVAAWGGEEVPYLTTVFQEEVDDGDKWERVFTQREFYDYLRSRSAFASLSDDEISMKILGKDPYGSDYITVLSVSDGSGNTITVENSEDIRSACGFTSANFKVEYSVDMPVLTSSGSVESVPVSGVLTADGYKPFSGFGDGVKTVAGVEYKAEKVVIKGSGVGHGVGFSATGSEKLSQDGYSYKYILTFFFNGTKLEYAK